MKDKSIKMWIAMNRPVLKAAEFGRINGGEYLVEYLPEDKHNVLNKRPDISKAKKEFGHNPKITLEEGIPKTIEWMKQVYGK